MLDISAERIAIIAVYNSSLVSFKYKNNETIKTYWHAYNLDSDVFSAGKTRTKDKYRVVYTDHQRLELEKEFHYSRYITIRRKSELASVLGLSERQVKSSKQTQFIVAI